jgi:deoxyribodipyrimidine photo-lyase
MATANMQLQQQFANRDELVDYCRQQFASTDEQGDDVSPIRGGAAAAGERLAAISPARYAKTRNALDGAVTRLSPYLRHGVLGLAEVARAAVATAGQFEGAAKLVQELAWRDYFRRYLDEIGSDIWHDQEDYKTGYAASEYAATMPADVLAARTGNSFVDFAVRELYQTGYLHNQLRMKLAAYLVHWRHVSWQAGAAWMLGHLLDGDLASNNLSWQWVASTFANKPYVFNQAGLLAVSDGQLDGCDTDGTSPFAGTNEQVSERLFR